PVAPNPTPTRSQGGGARLGRCGTWSPASPFFLKEIDVGHSICLLTASLLTAQVPQGGTIIQTQYEPAQYAPASKPGCNCQQGNNANTSEAFPRVRGFFRSANERCAQRPGLVNRIKDLFGGDSSPQYANQTQYAQPQNPPLA